MHGNKMKMMNQQNEMGFYFNEVNNWILESGILNT